MKEKRKDNYKVIGRGKAGWRAKTTKKNSIQVAGKGSVGNADLWNGAEDYYHSWYA
jgi:hypothetical protein